MRDYVFPPLILPLFVILILLPILLIFFVFTTSAVFQLVFGVDKWTALLIFLFIAIGSFFNVPIYEKEGYYVHYSYSVFGVLYRVRRRGKVVVAVNLGGCVFPTVLALKALSDVGVNLEVLMAIATATVLNYFIAKPVRGVGIVTPMIAPPLIATLAAFTAIFLSGMPLLLLPKLSFAVGVISTLLGADIMHLKDLEKIGEGVVSIGGAGTFDGIFLTGFFAVLFSLLLI
ncbi:MAG: DUF1614 domain-containing protein [Archaeoglobaceae archaeon]